MYKIAAARTICLQDSLALNSLSQTDSPAVSHCCRLAGLLLTALWSAGLFPLFPVLVLGWGMIDSPEGPGTSSDRAEPTSLGEGRD